MAAIFSEIDHRLSVIPRWAILHTIQNQSVAEHSFNVARMALRIAKNWYGIDDLQLLLAVSSYAIHHDDIESITSDIPSMIKKYINETNIYNDHHKHLRDVEFTLSGLFPDDRLMVKSIVKLADKLEGYYFLCMEIALGNQFVSRHHRLEFDIIRNLMLGNNYPNYTIDKCTTQLNEWRKGLESATLDGDQT